MNAIIDAIIAALDAGTPQGASEPHGALAFARSGEARRVRSEGYDLSGRYDAGAYDTIEGLVGIAEADARRALADEESVTLDLFPYDAPKGRAA